ncbi:MAG: hypothetical protein JST73_07150 [Actinobacteria bacterium]|nr:hypothetical protein [Actinomycetota bacterium]
MTQLVTRVDEALLVQVDALIEIGEVPTRSEAVRTGLRQLVDGAIRRREGEAIARAYREQPQSDDDRTWSDAATIEMIAAEPW